jgi:hypothetical protein
MTTKAGDHQDVYFCPNKGCARFGEDVEDVFADQNPYANCPSCDKPLELRADRGLKTSLPQQEDSAG